MCQWSRPLAGCMETLIQSLCHNAAMRHFVLTLLLLAFCMTPAAAKQYYKYQDEDGVWHYSDRAPDTDRPVETRQIRVEPRKAVTMRQVGSERESGFQFSNHLHGPVTVSARLELANNIRTEPALPAQFVLQGREQEVLFQVFPRDKQQSSKYRISYRALPGDPAATPQNVAYLPPVPVDGRFYISQGFNGDLTHRGPDARYAIDIVMPEGTPVLADRDGQVMEVQDDFFEGGQDEKRYRERANLVRVLHEDGTMAVYAHLKLESVRVRPGQVVLAGDPIAESGNTGYSSGPHLHFAVQRNTGSELVSIPFRFREQDGGSFQPTGPMPLTGVQQNR